MTSSNCACGHGLENHREKYDYRPCTECDCNDFYHYNEKEQKYFLGKPTPFYSVATLWAHTLIEEESNPTIRDYRRNVAAVLRMLNDLHFDNPKHPQLIPDSIIKELEK